MEVETTSRSKNTLRDLPRNPQVWEEPLLPHSSRGSIRTATEQFHCWPASETPATQWASAKQPYFADTFCSGLNSRPSWHCHRGRRRHPDPLPRSFLSSAWDSRAHQPGPPRPRAEAGPGSASAPLGAPRARGPRPGPRLGRPAPSPPAPGAAGGGGGPQDQGFCLRQGGWRKQPGPRLPCSSSGTARHQHPAPSAPGPHRAEKGERQRRCVEAAGAQAGGATGAAAALLCGPGQGKWEEGGSSASRSLRGSWRRRSAIQGTLGPCPARLRCGAGPAPLW